eukprot:CAMPEP_0170470262 /NCGR_PEP_ID=MMETSP0123-20130129/12777_1 /TAXON_ID=182087 /ORGANISM="Favella ehrenbergii, Strain Fehren 1" /LENGTH=50 /DNA_ID=CAMNT_0010737325 /DNA_START=1966 /DNA_END=2118 /DNA_ORIENTATION=-
MSPEKQRQTLDQQLRATHESPDIARVDTAEIVSTKKGDKLVLKSAAAQGK